MDKSPNDKALHEELKNHEQFLLDLGEGKLPANATVHGYNLIEITSSMCQPSKDEVIEKVFDDSMSHIGDAEYFQGRVLLATTNKIVDEVNDEMVERICHLVVVLAVSSLPFQLFCCCSHVVIVGFCFIAVMLLLLFCHVVLLLIYCHFVMCCCCGHFCFIIVVVDLFCCCFVVVVVLL